MTRAKNVSVVGLLLVLILQITVQDQAELLLNNNFIPTAVPCGGTVPCNTGYLPPWAAHYHWYPDRMYKAYSIYTDQAVTGGSGTNYWFDLKYQGNRACAVQKLTYMPAGSYVLTFNYYMDNTEFSSLTAPDRDKEKIENIVFITNNNDINGALVGGLLVNASASVTQTNVSTPSIISFSLASANSNVFFTICDRGDNGVSPKITNVHLKLICLGTQVKVTLKDGTQICAPSSILTTYPNCYRYQRVLGSLTDLQCSSCDLTGVNNPAKYPVTLTNNKMACAQINAPQATKYIVGTAKDSIGQFYLIPFSCSGVISINSFLSIPSRTASSRDQTSRPCLNDFGNVKYWQVDLVNNVYKPVDCASGFTLVNLQTGSLYPKACISTSINSYDENCDIYNYTSASNIFKCTTCFSSTNNPSPITTYIGGQPFSRCNKETCPAEKPFIVRNQYELRFCVAQLIQGCVYYNADNSCFACSSGAPYNPQTGKCPLTASAIIPNCLTVIQSNQKYLCTACIQGFTFDFDGKCVKNVVYCSSYKSGICISCITGYFLKDSVCLKQSSECIQTDSSGQCIQCLSGFIASRGLCIPNTQITCLRNQYKNLQGICVNGNVANCESYQSSSGQCQSCNSGYNLNSQNQCEKACPEPPSNKRFLYQSGSCILTDKQCIYANSDGSCPVCNSGFYSQQGSCRPIQESLQAQSEGFNEDGLLLDENNYFYYLNSDNSRTYATGPWANQRVWIDSNGYPYFKFQGRQYIGGPNSGSFFQIDSFGNVIPIQTSNSLRSMGN